MCARQCVRPLTRPRAPASCGRKPARVSLGLLTKPSQRQHSVPVTQKFVHHRMYVCVYIIVCVYADLIDTHHSHGSRLAARNTIYRRIPALDFHTSCGFSPVYVASVFTCDNDDDNERTSKQSYGTLMVSACACPRAFAPQWAASGITAKAHETQHYASLYFKRLGRQYGTAAETSQCKPCGLISFDRPSDRRGSGNTRNRNVR